MSVIYLIGSGEFWQSRKKIWVKPTKLKDQRLDYQH
jgi:hypothetical protein